MKEYVQDKVNGLLFKHRDVTSLTRTLSFALENPHYLESLGKKGYLYSENGNVINVHDHVSIIEKYYKELIKGER